MQMKCLAPSVQQVNHFFSTFLLLCLLSKPPFCMDSTKWITRACSQMLINLMESTPHSLSESHHRTPPSSVNLEGGNSQALESERLCSYIRDFLQTLNKLLISMGKQFLSYKPGRIILGITH